MKIDMPDLRDAACNTPGGRLVFGNINQYTIPQAWAICDRCPVKRPCGEWGVLHESEGMWGGMTGRQLHAERARRGIRLRELHAGWLSARAPKRRAGVAA